MIKQENLNINNVDIPIIKDESMVYYPISFMGSKVLLKSLSPVQLRENGYGEYIKQYEVDFGENTGSVQLTHCISEEGLKEILKNSKIGRLNIEQKRAMNKVCKYLKLDIEIDIEEQFIDKLSDDKIEKYDIFVQDCIYETLKINPNVKFQKCMKCNNYYPYTKDFFAENQHSSAELNTNCKTCQGWSENRSKIAITHPDKDLNIVYKKYGIDLYNKYKNKELLDIYKWYLESDLKFIPKILHNEDFYLFIVKYYYDLNKIDVKQKLLKEIGEELKLTSFNSMITIEKLYTYLFGKDYKLYPWEYPNLILKDITFEQAKMIFFNYLTYKNITINDVYNFDYIDEIIKCGLKCYTSKDILGFVMKLHDNKYGAYKFEKVVGQNYWKFKENANQALKFYIEEDQKIPIEKIPLYLTLNNLQKNARTLYYLIYNKRFHKTLFEWVNDVYPTKFDERDFNIGSIRNNFDSKEEEMIYEYLKDEYKNVIYNKRNCDNTVEVKGMIPDFIVFTENYCYFIEYFGLYVPNKVNTSKRISDYVKKTNIKIEKYKTIKHRVIYLFPEDLDENMSGLKEKLKDII